MQVVVDIAGKNFGDLGVFSAAGDDDVGILFIVADILIEHRFYGGHVLIRDAVNVPSAFDNVALDSAQKTDIGFHVHVQTEVHLIAQALIIESVNALKNNDIMGLEVFIGLVSAAVPRIVIPFSGYSLPIQERGDIPENEIVIKDTRLIEIEMTAFLEGHIRMIKVIGVLIDNENTFIDHGSEFLGKSRFTASACTADSNKQHRQSSFL
jgi:hypothetical protein